MLQERGSPRENDAWGEVMLAPDEVAAMVRLRDSGAVARLGLGDEADSRRVGVQPE